MTQSFEILKRIDELEPKFSGSFATLTEILLVILEAVSELLIVARHDEMLEVVSKQLFH